MRISDWSSDVCSSDLCVDIDLSHQTTVLTESNGSGKTSILNILSRHFGWNLLFVSTPFLSKRTRKKLYSDLRQDIWDEENTPASPAVISEERRVGKE